MKKISFMIAALLVAMTGCQKEPQVNPENNPGSNAETVGYVALKISLPSSTGTRADTAFDDGDAKEYAVNDVTVVFYDDAGKYMCHTAVDPKPWNKNGSDKDNITVTGKTPAIKVTKVVKQALVLVNSNGLIDAASLQEGATYAGLNKAIEASTANITGSEKDRFFMSNEPYYKNGKFTTLVPVEIRQTESSALASAQNVKVERAAAKVTVKYYENYVNVGSEAVVAGWNLDVTNKSFYPVRQGYDSNAANEWFTAADTPANQSIIGLSRIYWAKDPNYAPGNINGGILSAFNRVDNNDLKLTSEESAYCLENTFNTDCMNENQTTTVMLKVNYKPEGVSANQTWFQVGGAKAVYTSTTLAQYLYDKVEEAGYEITYIDGTEVEIVAAVAAELENRAAGKIADWLVDEQSNVLAQNLIGDIICYKNGICYYPVKVRHFTAKELGYADEAEFKNSFTASGYQPNDLGRYGVLRNTWYKITVNTITNPGSPVIPDPTDTPDDKFEQFVACTIDILAWSVRNHGVDL